MNKIQDRTLISQKYKNMKNYILIKKYKSSNFREQDENYYKNKMLLQKDMFSIPQSEIYPGLCTLCFQNQHISVECPYGLIFYHATNLKCLNSILQNGLHAKPGRLGAAVYFSDDPLMCIKYVTKNKSKFLQPILMRVKVMVDGKIKQLKNWNQIKQIKPEQIKKKNIQMIKCPYFRQVNNTKYEFALLKAEYVITSWGFINNQQSLHRQKKSIINIQNSQQNNCHAPILLADQQKQINDVDSINILREKQQIQHVSACKTINEQKQKLIENKGQIGENYQDYKEDYSECQNEKKSRKALRVYQLVQNEGLRSRKKIKKIKKIKKLKDQFKKYNLRVRSNINYCFK